MESKQALIAAVVLTMIHVSPSNAQVLSTKQQQSCANQLKDAQQKAPANGLLCSIWNDEDCRAMAVQKGILSKGCMNVPLRKLQTQ